MTERGERFDAYREVTNQVVAMLEARTAPWRMAWNPTAGMPRSLQTGHVYRSSNLLVLNLVSMVQGYSSPWWGTWDQIHKRDGRMKKGEHHTGIVFWKRYIKDEGTEQERTSFALRWYRVWNLDQATGLAAPPGPIRPEHERIAECDEAVAFYLRNGGPRLVEGGSRAAYSPTLDRIMLPALSAFDSPADYHAAKFHELAHSTGHASRLNREGITEDCVFGDPTYSREELVAEMGAAFLAGHTGISALTLPNSAAYLAGWLKALEADHKLVVAAAGQAQKACDLVMGVQLDITGQPKEAPATAITGRPRPTAGGLE